jgi:hypothetical protein
MAKIVRKTFATIFGSGAASTDIEQFGAQEQTGAPNYTTDPDVIQALSAWADGWRSAIISTNRAPYIQDMNAVLYALSWGVSYLHEMGIPEWDSGTPYYTNSYIQYNGVIYKSLVDDNLNNTPPTGASNAYWNLMRLGSSLPTRTILTSGSGTYTTPSGATRLFIRAVGGGGGCSNSVNLNTANPGGNTTFGSVTANGGNAGISNSSNFNASGGGGYGGAGTASLRIAGQIGDFAVAAGYQMQGRGGSSFLGPGGGFQTAEGGVVGSFIRPYGGGEGGSVGGGSASNPTVAYCGGGGEYFELLINNPASSYAYSVGAGAVTTQSGTGGADGVIIIDEYYD